MRRLRRCAALAAALGMALTASACGGSSTGASHSTTSSSSTDASGSGATGSGATITMVESTFPQSLDPGFDYSATGYEVNSSVYTGLIAFRSANGVAGTTLIPGLATSLPRITDGGRTYTLTLRKHLVFSNGKPVVASDFAYTFERALRIPWGGSGQFMTPRVVGAAAYAAHRATSISGITTDDASGRIVIHLTAPYGPFEDVLALPDLGLVPAGTPMHNEPLHPPPGVGPYKVTHIVANQSFDVVRNPLWPKMHVPGIPVGHVNTDVRVGADLSSNALSVLNNSVDVFDYNDTVPGSLVSQVTARAAGRYMQAKLGIATWYIFLNTREKPFSSEQARQAVAVGLDHDALDRLDSGDLEPACYLLPPAVPGHPTAPCPYGAGTGDLARAKALVKKSGMAGQHVTVWSRNTQPDLSWMTLYAQLLDQIGFKATLKTIAAATFDSTVGELRLHPQTGAFEWIEDFPNPTDYYGVLLDGPAIEHTNNLNFGEVDDPHINAVVARLAPVPPAQLSHYVSQWQALDEYAARKAYVVPIGYPTFPKFVSDRIDYGALVINPVYGWAFSSFELK